MAMMKSWISDVFSAALAICLIGAAIAFNLEAFLISVIFFAGVLVSGAVLVILNEMESSGKH